MTLRQTHTFVVLELSAQAYNEIAEKLRAAGYTHAFDEKAQLIDMHGIAVTPAVETQAMALNEPPRRLGKPREFEAPYGKSPIDENHTDGFGG